MEIIERDGVKYSSRILNDEEYRHQLVAKLVEEAKEVQEATGPEEIIKEIADVWEVIEAIIVEFGLDHSEIQRVKQERRDSRGGFDKKIYLEHTDE